MLYQGNKSSVPLSSDNITLYDLVKGEPTNSAVHVSNKWGDADALTPQPFANSKVQVSVSYGTPSLKRKLRKLVRSRRAKPLTSSDVPFIVEDVTPNAVHIVSDVTRDSFVPYLRMFEDPDAPVWDDLLKTVVSRTGRAIGNIFVRVIAE